MLYMLCLDIASTLPVLTYWSPSYLTGPLCWSQLYAVCLFVWVELCNLGNYRGDDMLSEDIISNLQHCFKWTWQLQFIPARHSCSLYVPACVLPHMIKCYDLWPCITKQMKTIKKTFQNSCCQYSQLMEITDIVILNEI